MHKYKNISENQQTVIGVGVVEPGGEFVSPVGIENPNFEYIGPAEGAAGISGVQHQGQPGAVTEAQPAAGTQDQPAATDADNTQTEEQQ